MTREEAINYLRSSGMSEKQIDTVVTALSEEPCSDAISRQALKDALVHDWAFHFPQTKYNERKGYRKRDREVSTVIENMSPIIPSRSKGHWIGIDDKPFTVFVCDICRTTYDTVDKG